MKYNLHKMHPFMPNDIPFYVYTTTWGDFSMLIQLCLSRAHLIVTYCLFYVLLDSVC